MARQSGSTQDEVRRHNVSMLLRQVHVRGALSRTELTSLMGLNRSTIKALVTDLGGAGLVTEEIPETRLGAGRPSHLVVPRGDATYVLAANVGIDAVSVAAVGLGGQVLSRREYRIAGVGAKPDVFAGRLAHELRRTRSNAAPGAWLAGVGVGLPGIIRRADGYVEQAPNLTWRDVPFGQILAERLDVQVPLRIANDGDLGALAEHLRGAGRGVDNMIYIVGEVGVGGGIVAGGRMVEGSGGYAGEIGHMIVNPGGRRCRCGSRGCFETEVGEDAVLVACGRKAGGGRQALREAIAAAQAGEASATEGMRLVAVWLARGISSLVNIFNPDLVVLSGPLAAVFEVARGTVREEMESLTLLASRQRVRVVASGLGEDSSLLGAAELAFEHLLRDPVSEWWRRIG